MKANRFWHLWDRAGIFFALLALVIVFAVINPDFRKPANISNILQQCTPIGIAAIGMTFAIISGAFDLSVGSTMALTACVMVSLINVVGFYFAFLIALALGFCLGLTNGLIITKIKVPPFIATLANLWVFRALAYIYTQNKPMQSTAGAFTCWGESIFYVPRLFIVMVICYLLAFFILYHTPFGRHVFAIGSNRRAAILSGINVAKVSLFVFGLVGFFGAIAGSALAVRLWSAKADTALGYELMVIATVVLGGTSLKGGSGTLAGTFGAAVLFTVIYNAMDMFQVQSYWQKIALGVILLVALSLDRLRRKYMIIQSRSAETNSGRGMFLGEL
jgi:ribose/xylose/arabinose/galactoside ABC-type transport system permease subunit